MISSSINAGMFSACFLSARPVDNKVIPIPAFCKISPVAFPIFSGFVANLLHHFLTVVSGFDCSSIYHTSHNGNCRHCAALE
jgi:hypothetical protein